MINAIYCCPDASAFSLGFAAAHQGTVLLEKSENALSDYVNAVIPGFTCQPHSKEGTEFFNFLKKNNCISQDGIIDSPSLAPAAAEYALNFDIVLNAKVISVQQRNDGYNILIHTNGGLENVFCKKVVSHPSCLNNIKYLNCIVSDVTDKKLSSLEKYGAVIHKSFEKGEFIVSMPFDKNLQLNEARISFVERMKDCFGTSVMIDAFAVDFADNSYGDIISDFEAGVDFDL